MVAAGLRDNAAASFLFGQREDGVGGTANLERAGLLQILALEEELRSGERVDRVTGEDGSAVDARTNAVVCLDDGIPID